MWSTIFPYKIFTGHLTLVNRFILDYNNTNKSTNKYIAKQNFQQDYKGMIFRYFVIYIDNFPVENQHNSARLAISK